MGNWLVAVAMVVRWWRTAGDPVVEDSWRLDLSHCIRQGMIRPGLFVAGKMTWTLTRTGEVAATIGYDANLVDPADAWIRLYYATTIQRTGEKRYNNYLIRLECTRPNYGGLRWWFICPKTSRRVRVLYLPPSGGTVFACRQAWGLAYHSQRISPEDRADERSLKARKRLWGKGPEHAGDALLPAAEVDASANASEIDLRCPRSA